jgi:type II secretory pathway pseudopilin PulG
MIHYKQLFGFSLVETLVAISLLLIVITGPLSIASQSAQSTNYANEEIVAYFLAQEGAELAQKARDDLLLPYFTGSSVGTEWTQFLDGGTYDICYNSAGCGLEIEPSVAGNAELVITDCSVTGACRLYINATAEDRARYTHTTGSSTPYTRTITLAGQDEDGDGDDDSVRVQSSVTWRTGEQIREQSTTVTTYLFNTYVR